MGTSIKPAASPSLKQVALQTAAAAVKSAQAHPASKLVVDVFTSVVKAVAAEAVVFGRNLGSGPLNSSTGPIPQSAWSDPTLLVGAMTQNRAGAQLSSSAARCGNTNLFAAALLSGPAAAAKLLQTTAQGSKLLTPGQKKDLTDLAARIKNHTATFEDLSAAQDLLYAASNTRSTFGDVNTELAANGNLLQGADLAKYERLKAKIPELNAAEQRQFSELLSTAIDREVSVVIENDPRLGKQLYVNSFPGSISGDTSGLDDKELTAAARAGGAAPVKLAFDASKPGSVEAVMAKLKPGESVVLRVGLDSSSTAADHFVTVGKLKDGRPYVYNPDPYGGDATLTVGVVKGPQSASFRNEVAKYSARARRDLGVKDPQATKVQF